MTTSQTAFKGLSTIVSNLPTGTLFLFQTLSPILTHNGRCHPVNRILFSGLIFLCCMSCLLFSFSDSYTDAQGTRLYGIATTSGIWFGGNKCVRGDLSEYRIGVGDLVHAMFSLFVFGAVALLDTNTVGCFFPSLLEMQSVLLMALPPLIGIVSAIVFIVYPNKRHGLRLQPRGGVWGAAEHEDEKREPDPESRQEQHRVPVEAFQYHQKPEDHHHHNHNHNHITSISYFVTNFPDHLTARDLWIIFSRSVGPVVDVTIPRARTRRGTRFAYVRFQIRSIEEAEECARRICGVWWGSYKLVVYPARPRRFSDHYHPAFVNCVNDGEVEMHEVELGQMNAPAAAANGSYGFGANNGPGPSSTNQFPSHIP